MASQLVEPITALRNPPTAVAAMPTVPEVPAARPVGYMPVVRTAAPVPAPQGAEICSLRLQREANAVALSPDGRRAVVGFQDHTLQIWDLDARLLLHVLRGHKYWVNDVDYSRDGTWIASASADKSIKVWQASTGACKATLQGHLLSVSAVAFAGDRRRLASGSWDKTVCIWDTEETSPVQTLTGHTDWVHSVAWSPGGHHVASASSDHSVRVWDVFAGTVDCVLVGHLQTVSSVSFAANGVYLASGSLDGTVRVWNLKEGALAARLTQDTDGSSVHSVTFSAEGEMIVVACADRSIKVWSLSTSEQLTSLNGHEDPVQCVATTSDGRAVSCSHDKTMRVWRLPRPVAILTKAPPALVPRVAMLSPGRGAVTRLSPRMQDLQAQLKESERRNQQLKAHLSEAQSEASRGDLSRSEVSRLQSGPRAVINSAACLSLWQSRPTASTLHHWRSRSEDPVPSEAAACRRGRQLQLRRRLRDARRGILAARRFSEEDVCCSTHGGRYRSSTAMLEHAAHDNGRFRCAHHRCKGKAYPCDQLPSRLCNVRGLRGRFAARNSKNDQ